jgi:8-oxo-dGTP pyrophosphatase MutT (NUDIX family)
MAAMDANTALHPALSALQATLAGYQPQALDEPGLADAAVLLLLYERDGALTTVFQRRSHTVLHHKGQVSLPGGAVDADDQSLQHAALREAHEEIGARPSLVRSLGRLDDIRTISGFRVAPFVGWYSDRAPEWIHNHHEVAYLMQVPLGHLAHPDAYVPDLRPAGGRLVELPSYQVGPDLIWGATARIVQNFLDVLTASGLSLDAPLKAADA